MYNQVDNLLVLRGIASFTVVLNHLLGLSPIKLYVPYGFHMVWLFFFLSAYLLTKGFLSGKFTHKKEFYMSRAKRLLPTFYVVQILVIILAISGIAPQEYFSTVDLFKRLVREGSVLLLAPWTPYILASGSWNSVIWSVVVEIHFILLLPAIVWMSIRKFMILFLIWIVLIAALYLIGIEIWNRHYEAHYYNAGFFIAGILTAKIKQKNSFNVIPSKFAIFMLLFVIVLIDIFAHFDLQLILSIAPIPLAFCLVVLFLFINTNYQRPLPRRLKDFINGFGFVKTFELLGAISYSLYLSHKFFGITLIYYTNFFIGFALMLTISILLYLMVEIRIRF